jgi:nitrite reductase (NO-forming)
VRRRWLLTANVPVVAWLLVAAAYALTASTAETDLWLLTHVALLGAAGSAILVWSQHFASSLLRLRDLGHLYESLRLITFNIGVAVLLIGGSRQSPSAMIVGGTVVITVFCWHAFELTRQLRRSLPARFAVSVRYYVVGTVLAIAGSAIGVLLASGHVADPQDARWNITHMVLNIQGWMVLTIIGTLVTFWPTLLGAQVVPSGVSVARKALVFLSSTVIWTGLAAGLGLRVLAVIGQMCFVVVLCWSLLPYVHEFQKRTRLSFAAASVMASQLWLIFWSLAFAVLLASRDDDVSLEHALMSSILVFVLGVAVQVLVGSLSFLLPMAIGHGPAPVRANVATLELGKWLRLVSFNAGVVLVGCGTIADSSIVVRIGLLITSVTVIVFLTLVVLVTARQKVIMR